jgi:hypothetical protein
MSFLKSIENRKVKQPPLPFLEVWYQWEGEDIRKGCRRVNTVEIL